MVGEAGLEPAISCSQSTCVANYATPRRTWSRAHRAASDSLQRPRRGWARGRGAGGPLLNARLAAFLRIRAGDGDFRGDDVTAERAASRARPRLWGNAALLERPRGSRAEAATRAS